MAGLEMTVVVKYFDKGVPGRAARGRGRLVQRYRPRRGTDCCVIARLCNRVWVEISAVAVPPLSLINSEPPGSDRSRPGREARRSRSLDGEDRAVQSRAAAAEPPSIRVLDSEIPGFFVSTGSVAPTTCFNYYLSSICICYLLARTLEGECYLLARTLEGAMLSLSPWKTPPIHGLLWKTSTGTMANRALGCPRSGFRG